MLLYTEFCNWTNNFPKYIVKCCQGCTFKQLPHYTQNIVLTIYRLSIVLFFENSSSKASGLLFIFAHVSTGHAHFQNDEICIPWMPMRPSTVFSVAEFTKKAGSKVCEQLLHRAFNLGKKPIPSRQSLPVSKCPLLLVHTLLSCFKG